MRPYFYKFLIGVVISLVAPFSIAELSEDVLQKSPRDLGNAVKDAAVVIYAGDGGQRQKIEDLGSLLDQVSSVGSEAAVRYSVIGILVAGGEAHIDDGAALVEKQFSTGQYREIAFYSLARTVALMRGRAVERRTESTADASLFLDLPGAGTMTDPLGDFTAADAAFSAWQAVENARKVLADIEKSDDPSLIIAGRDALQRAESAALRAEVYARKEALAKARDVMRKLRVVLKRAKESGGLNQITVVEDALRKAEKTEADAMALFAEVEAR